jgi:hypothetical protein
MKNLISKEEKDRIDLICKEYDIDRYEINSDGSIDVSGDVDLTRIGLDYLPLNFNKVSGSFCCNDNDLTSLSGSPVTVGGDFDCSINGLTSLEGSPITVGGYYSCFHNKLTSTYSGDTDIEVSGLVRSNFNYLPQEMVDNLDHIKLILKYQRHFYIWNDDLTLNVENFKDLIAEIEDGLE